MCIRFGIRSVRAMCRGSSVVIVTVHQAAMCRSSSVVIVTGHQAAMCRSRSVVIVTGHQAAVCRSSCCYSDWSPVCNVSE